MQYRYYCFLPFMLFCANTGLAEDAIKQNLEKRYENNIQELRNDVKIFKEVSQQYKKLKEAYEHGKKADTAYNCADCLTKLQSLSQRMEQGEVHHHKNKQQYYRHVIRPILCNHPRIQSNFTPEIQYLERAPSIEAQIENTYKNIKRLQSTMEIFESCYKKASTEDHIIQEGSNTFLEHIQDTREKLLQETFFPSQEENSPLLMYFYGNQTKTNHATEKLSSMPYCGYFEHKDIILRLLNNNTKADHHVYTYMLHTLAAYQEMLTATHRYSETLKAANVKQTTKQKKKSDFHKKLQAYYKAHQQLLRIYRQENIPHDMLMKTAKHRSPLWYIPENPEVADTSHQHIQSIISATQSYIKHLKDAYVFTEIYNTAITKKEIHQLAYGFYLLQQHTALENTLINEYNNSVGHDKRIDKKESKKS